MRCSREKKAVFEVRGNGPDDLSALRVAGVATPPGWGALMDLVHDQQVETTGVHVGVGGKDVADQPHATGTLEPVDGHDEAGKVAKGIGAHPPAAAQLPEQLGVHDAKLQPEAPGHLGLPLEGERGRADDEHGAGPVAQKELLGHQAGLDGLAQPHVIGDQQVDPGHAQGPYHRIQLVVLDGDARAERGLQGMGVSRGDRPPAHRVQEGIQVLRIVKAPQRGHRQGGRLQDPGARLHLPDDRQLGVVLGCVVLHRGQLHQVLAQGTGLGHLVGSLAGRHHLAHHPVAVPHHHQLPQLGRESYGRSVHEGHTVNGTPARQSGRDANWASDDGPV